MDAPYGSAYYARINWACAVNNTKRVKLELVRATSARDDVKKEER